MQQHLKATGKRRTKRRTNCRQKAPTWKARLKRKIEEIRCELSVQDAISRNSNIFSHKGRKTNRKYTIEVLNENPLIK